MDENIFFFLGTSWMKTLFIDFINSFHIYSKMETFWNSNNCQVTLQHKH